MDAKIAIRRVSLLLLLFTLCAVTALAQTTSFTYQGRLQDGGTPANGSYDLQFALFDALSGGAQVGATQTISTVSVSGGAFTVQLDFGGSAFPGADRFLEIGVRPAGGSGFTTLTPRQQISSTPYAIRSANATTATTATNATTAANLSGTPALPSGTTATTQSQADASTKLATTAYVDTGLATKQNSLAYTAENQANKSTNTSLGNSDTLYPTQKAVKTYVDNHAPGGPGGNDGDLQMKSGTSLAASAINDNGTVLGVTRPFELRQSATNIARWTLNGDNSLTLAATPIGSTTLTERLHINSTGDLLLGTTASPTANSGKVMVFGENGATNPTMEANTAGLFAKDVLGTTRLFVIDEAGNATQITGSENSDNKSTNTSLGTSDTLYPTQNAVKTYVDNHVTGGGGGGGASPSGNDGDLQMKSGTSLAPSAINDNGTVLSVNRPIELRQSGTNFARWTFNGNNSLSLAATLSAPSTPTASLVTDGTGNCTAGTHQFKVTYITFGGETNASTASNSITCDASHTKVTITLPTGSTTNGTNTIATGRNIYATKAGGSTYFLIAPSPVVNNNTTTVYTFNISDSSFAATQAPAANTAVDARIFVDNLGNVGFGTTSPQFTDDSQGRSVAIDGGAAEGYLGIGATSVTNVTGRVGALNFYNIAQGGVDHRVASIMAFNDGALGKGQLVFMTSASSIGPSGAGSINSEQNWGIGRNAVSGVKLIVKAPNTLPTGRVLSIENSTGSAAFLTVWNDGKFELANGKFQVDAGPFQVDSNGEVSARSFKWTSAARPACDSNTRGKVWYVAGGAGVKDTFEVCAKNASDAYAWRVIY